MNNNGENGDVSHLDSDISMEGDQPNNPGNPSVVGSENRMLNILYLYCCFLGEMNLSGKSCFKISEKELFILQGFLSYLSTSESAGSENKNNHPKHSMRKKRENFMKFMKKSSEYVLCLLLLCCEDLKPLLSPNNPNIPNNPTQSIEHV